MVRMQSEQMLHNGISHFATSGHKIKRSTNSGLALFLGIDSQANSCLHTDEKFAIQERVFQAHIRSAQMS